jgi:hypothetical protein
MLRLFVAVDLPEPLRTALVSAFAVLPESARGKMRVVRAELLHLTLKFLGNVEEERAGEIAEATRAAIRGVRAQRRSWARASTPSRATRVPKCSSRASKNRPAPSRRSPPI